MLKPTTNPTEPMFKPTTKPMLKPMTKPMLKPTLKPMLKPTLKPMWNPTLKPTWKPTLKPTPQRVPSGGARGRQNQSARASASRQSREMMSGDEERGCGGGGGGGAAPVGGHMLSDGTAGGTKDDQDDSAGRAGGRGSETRGGGGRRHITQLTNEARRHKTMRSKDGHEEVEIRTTEAVYLGQAVQRQSRDIKLQYRIDFSSTRSTNQLQHANRIPTVESSNWKHSPQSTQ